MTLQFHARDKRLIMVMVNVVVVTSLFICAFLQVTLAKEGAETTLNKTSFIPVQIRVESGEMNDVSGGGMANETTDIFKETNSSTQVLKAFDKDGDERLDRKEFRALCESLFRNESMAYPIDDEMLDAMFQSFDWNKNGYICADEFEICYKDWIQKILKPVTVLVVVDVQNDFVSGTLALKNAPAGQDGKMVIEPINEMQNTIHFDKVFYTKDWHPKDHISFIDNVEKYPLHKSSPIQNPKEAKVMDTVIFAATDGHPVEQRLWPAHCVQQSWGSELDPQLDVVNGSGTVFKGLQSDVDSYSAFLDNDKKSMTPLKQYIDEVGAKDVYVCGLAYDYCVGGTALDALNLGYRTVVVEDATGMIDEETAIKMRANILAMGGLIINTSEVENMVVGMDRRPEMGLHLAKTLHKEKMQVIIEKGDQSNTTN